MSIQERFVKTDARDFMTSYLESLALVERLHRLLLDVIKDEFERLGLLDITRFKRCYCLISPTMR